MRNTATVFENPRTEQKQFSKTGRMSVLLTGVAALVLFPLFAVVKAADTAVKNF